MSHTPPDSDVEEIKDTNYLLDTDFKSTALRDLSQLIDANTSDLALVCGRPQSTESLTSPLPNNDDYKRAVAGTLSTYACNYTMLAIAVVCYFFLWFSPDFTEQLSQHSPSTTKYV